QCTAAQRNAASRSTRLATPAQRVEAAPSAGSASDGTVETSTISSSHCRSRHNASAILLLPAPARPSNTITGDGDGELSSAGTEVYDCAGHALRNAVRASSSSNRSSRLNLGVT